MMKPTVVHLTTIYKLGHQRLRVQTGLHAKSIASVQEVPMEVPDYTDGVLTRVTIFSGESFMVTEEYSAVMKQWEEALGDED